MVKLYEHGFLTPDDFNGDLFAGFPFLKNTRSDHVGKHSLA
jgi:hypothetical protein